MDAPGPGAAVSARTAGFYRAEGEESSIPLFVQFIIAHFGLDLVRMASIHTPSPFATALGLVGALLIGQSRGGRLLSPEVLLYSGLVALGVFSTPSYELSMANRVILLLMIMLTGVFRLPGFTGESPDFAPSLYHPLFWFSPICGPSTPLI